jgi:subtilase family serine protease
VGSAPRLPSGARLTGPVTAAQPIQLSIALKSRDPAGLEALATAVSTPGSVQFRRYLSVTDFAQRYGATPDQITAVQSELRANGLTVSAPMANGLTLDASGTAAAVQHAFATSLHQVQLVGGRAAYANTVAPTLPFAVASAVQGVVGLNDLTLVHPEGPVAPPLQPEARPPLVPRAFGAAPRGPAASVATGGPQPCAVATSAAAKGGYTAESVAAAYGFSSLYGNGDLGAGQTIALYELEPYDAVDIAGYQACYGTDTPVTNVAVDNPPPFKSGDDDREAALDIEQVIGLAPAARIIVYQAPDNAAGAVDDYGAIVSQNQAKVVSSSWGLCEAAALAGGPALVGAENTLLQEAAVQGQSVFVASGDTGSAACVQSSSTDQVLSVQDPAAQPFATAVGGTSLFTGLPGKATLWTPGQPVQQSVWNDKTSISSSGEATGGGISSVWAMPHYQSGAQASLGVINGFSSAQPCRQAPFCREVPDVSADGDPFSGYAMFAGGSWQIAGGTSASAPLWAALAGLINADSSCRGQTVGFVNPALYRIAGSAYAANFSDVTLASPITGAANNDALGVNGGLYPVTAGFDMTTGLGTPVAPTLAASLCDLASPAFSIAISNPGVLHSRIGTSATFQVQATDSGGVPVTYTASGLPAGLTINPATGFISGTPTAPQIATVKIGASDKWTNSGSAIFSWVIAGNPTITSIRLGGLARQKPQLSFTAQAGVNAPSLTAIVVRLPKGLSFVRRSRRLAKGIRVRFPGRRVRATLALRHGRLRISMNSVVSAASVKIARPALTISRSLASKARRHKLRKLTVAIQTTDAADTTFRVAVTVEHPH